MSTTQWWFLAVVFLAGVFVSYVAFSRLLPSALGRRVEALASEGGTATGKTPQSDAGWRLALARWLKPLAGWSLPKEAWEQSPLRFRFYRAGFRSPGAPVAFFGAKTLLTFLLPALLLPTLWMASIELEHTVLLISAIGAAAIGYYLPNLALAQLVARRQRELFEAFPDALDLMRVCVQAGLGLDAAIERVGHEMALESEAIADEFHLVSLELRAGASRADALRSLAVRVAQEDIDAMVSMLVQADRFGTSIAESLRVHAESLRSKRKLLAEEAAAKLPVKLLIPLIFFVFPALLTVLLGPAVISVMRILLPRFAGQ